MQAFRSSLPSGASATAITHFTDNKRTKKGWSHLNTDYLREQRFDYDRGKLISYRSEYDFLLNYPCQLVSALNSPQLHIGELNGPIEKLPSIVCYHDSDNTFIICDKVPPFLIESELKIQDGEETYTLKLVREVIEAKYLFLPLLCGARKRDFSLYVNQGAGVNLLEWSATKRTFTLIIWGVGGCTNVGSLSQEASLLVIEWLLSTIDKALALPGEE